MLTRPRSFRPEAPRAPAVVSRAMRRSCPLAVLTRLRQRRCTWSGSSRRCRYSSDDRYPSMRRSATPTLTPRMAAGTQMTRASASCSSDPPGTKVSHPSGTSHNAHQRPATKPAAPKIPANASIATFQDVTASTSSSAPLWTRAASIAANMPLKRMRDSTTLFVSAEAASDDKARLGGLAGISAGNADHGLEPDPPTAQAACAGPSSGALLLSPDAASAAGGIEDSRAPSSRSRGAVTVGRGHCGEYRDQRQAKPRIDEDVGPLRLAEAAARAWRPEREPVRRHETLPLADIVSAPTRMKEQERAREKDRAKTGHQHDPPRHGPSLPVPAACRRPQHRCGGIQQAGLVHNGYPLCLTQTGSAAVCCPNSRRGCRDRPREQRTRA